MRSVVLGWAFLLLIGLFAPAALAQPASPPAPPAAAAPAQPRVCTLGAFVVSIYDVDTRAHTFSGDFWLWSLCPSGGPDPLESLEVVNAVEVEESLASSEPRGEVTWTARKISGKFRHGFDLSDYPFDRHRLRLRLEESEADVREVVFTADEARSEIARDLQMHGWRMTDFRVRAGQALYPTTFGDPTLPAGSTARYARFDVEVAVARAQLSSFFKLVTPLYVAAALALVSFALQKDSDSIINPRIGLLAGVMFAAVLNMRMVDEAVGASEGLTLIDTIHITALVLILVAAVSAMAWARFDARGCPSARLERWDRRLLVWSAAVFLIVNILLIAEAIRPEPV
jgi:hypothetical protein